MGPQRDLSAPAGRCSCALTGHGRCDFIRAWPKAPSLSCPTARPVCAAPHPTMSGRTTMTSITPQDAAIGEVAGGVDTHADTHTAAVIDPVGRVVGTEQFPATPAGYHRTADLDALLSGGWAGSESRAPAPTAPRCDPAGCTRRGARVIEVDRPDRKTRRFPGQVRPRRRRSAAARTALACPAHRSAAPKQARRPGRSAAQLAGGPAPRGRSACRRPAADQGADRHRPGQAARATARLGVGS